MSRIRVAHLLDDFALGGVVKGLNIYDEPELLQIAASTVIPVNPDRALAPRVQADLIVTHFPPRWSALPFLWSLRMRNPGARLIHVEHSYTRCWETLKVGARSRFRWMLRLAFAVFDKVVSVSSAQGEWLRTAAQLKGTKLIVIPPWSAPRGLETVPPSDWHGERPLRIGSYGRFAEAKGFERLITSFRSLDPARFQLLIGGFGENEAKLLALAAECPNIHFTGQVNDLAGFLSLCDVVAVPSIWEAYGQVGMEARLAGRSILVSGVDGLAEQAEFGGRIVDFHEPTALAATLASLDGETLAALNNAARASAAGLGRERISAWARLMTSSLERSRQAAVLELAQELLDEAALAVSGRGRAARGYGVGTSRRTELQRSASKGDDSSPQGDSHGPGAVVDVEL